MLISGDNSIDHYHNGKFGRNPKSSEDSLDSSIGRNFRSMVQAPLPNHAEMLALKNSNFNEPEPESAE